jgi:hypothetical protein
MSSNEPKLQQVINPAWIKPSMTIHQAANQAAARSCILKASWSPQFGLRVVAIPRNG